MLVVLSVSLSGLPVGAADGPEVDRKVDRAAAAAVAVGDAEGHREVGAGKR